MTTRAILFFVVFLVVLCVPGRLYAHLDTEEVQEVSRTIQKLVPYLKERTVAIKLVVGQRAGFGSGAIISPDGLILTCSHVVEISDNLTVITSSGQEYPATKLGMNSNNDYALLRIAAYNLPYFQLGTASERKILEWVIALGHPGGPYPDHQPAVAAGLIRGFGKKLPILLGNKFYRNAIQTDVPIFSGNSGGPLVDLNGRLIGINGAIMLINDLAFAVPIDEIKQDLDALKQGVDVPGYFPGFWELIKILMELQEDIPLEDMEKIFKDSPLGRILEFLGEKFPQVPLEKPPLGVNFREQEGKIVVSYIKKNQIADMAGLKEGDWILAVNKEEVTSSYGLKKKLENARAGDIFHLTILRNGHKKELLLILDKKGYSRDRCLQRVFASKGFELKEMTVKIYSGEDLLGYGVIISSDGWIITSLHVIAKHRRPLVQLQNDPHVFYPATVTGTHGIYDIALLKIQPKAILKAIPLGDDRKLKVGEWVLSGGNEEGVIKTGMISAVQREIPTQRRIPTMGLFGLLGKPNKGPIRAYQEVIHHDTNIDIEHFGTPLVNLQGELVGINVGHFYRSTTLATPITLIKEVLSDLKKGKNFETPAKYMPYEPKIDPYFRLLEYFLNPKKKDTDELQEIFRDIWGQTQKKKEGFLGVQIAEHRKGVEILEVIPGYSAHRAGIKKGDILCEINKQKIDSVVYLIEQVQKSPPGTKITFTVLRREKEKYIQKQIEVTLDQRP